jgi:signal transduction histidine kinase
MTLATSATYLSLLLLYDWTRYTMEPQDMRHLGLRVVFFWVVGYVTHRLAETSREETRKLKAAGEQLADANRSLREAEAAMRRSERLAALGQMAAGLAHELRNPLGTMRASAEMLERAVAQESEVAREMAGFIRTEVDRTNSLVTRFLDFARPLKLRRASAELSDVIDRAVADLERHIPPFPLTVYKNYSPDIRPIEIDGELIERVVYNLLLNAAQASPPGGVVTIKTRPLDGAVEISVIDRGAGIEAGQMENIFNPFFTTKPDGVGLGLAIVQKIVDEHGGEIAVESEPDRGSVFRVFLPALQA